MCRSIRAENLSHFGFNTYDMLVQELTKAPFDTFSEGTCICYGTSTAAVTELKDKWQEGFFPSLVLLWKCTNHNKLPHFHKTGNISLKAITYMVFVYMKIHVSIKFNFAIFVVFKLQVWGFWRGINNSFPFHLEWFKKKNCVKVKFFTIERNYWNTGDPYLLGWLLFYVFVKKPQK